MLTVAREGVRKGATHSDEPRLHEELDYRRHGHGARGRRPGRAPRRRHLDSWLLMNYDHRSVV